VLNGSGLPDAGSEQIGPPPRPRGASRLAELTARLRDFGRRRRALVAVVGSLATAAVLALPLVGRRHEFAAATSDAAAWVLAVTVLLQIVALLARSEAWHLTIQAAAGRSTAAFFISPRASFFDAIAVLIAVVTLGQLPVGPTAGAAAAVLILGSDGVAAAAAAGVLMTVTGTVGGLCFAGWAGADRLWSVISRARLRRAVARAPWSR
jgi:hypothetical protein